MSLRLVWCTQLDPVRKQSDERRKAAARAGQKGPTVALGDSNVLQVLHHLNAYVGPSKETK